jgi:hypothetical protein
MKIRARIRSALVALLAAVSAFAALPASAASTAGSTSSNVPSLSDAQTFWFSGSGAGSVHGQTGIYGCYVNGDDTVGTITQGSGGFSGTCNTPCGTVGVSGGYTRTAALVSLSGITTSGCLSEAFFSGECLFVPTSGLRVTSYALSCEVNVGSAGDIVALVGTGAISPGLTSPGIVAIAGTGTISPGLTTTGGNQTFSFSGNGAGSVRGETGQYSCGVNGNDYIGTTTQGNGGFSGTCNTPCGTVGVNGNYSRTVGLVSVNGGSVTSGCLTGSAFSGDCVFIPTSGPTIKSYAVVCGFTVS